MVLQPVNEIKCCNMEKLISLMVTGGALAVNGKQSSLSTLKLPGTVTDRMEAIYVNTLTSSLID